MGKIVMPKTNSLGEVYIDLKDFSDIINTDKVEYYAIIPKNKDSFQVKFYDKKKKLVKPNVGK